MVIDVGSVPNERAIVARLLHSAETLCKYELSSHYGTCETFYQVVNKSALCPPNESLLFTPRRNITLSVNEHEALISTAGLSLLQSVLQRHSKKEDQPQESPYPSSLAYQSPPNCSLTHLHMDRSLPPRPALEPSSHLPWVLVIRIWLVPHLASHLGLQLCDRCSRATSFGQLSKLCGRRPPQTRFGTPTPVQTSQITKKATMNPTLCEAGCASCGDSLVP